MEHPWAGSDNRCHCGRLFPQRGALAKHRRTCQKSKKRLSSALDKAKQAWTEKKQRRLGIADAQTLSTGSGLVRAPSPMIEDTPQVCHCFIANIPHSYLVNWQLMSDSEDNHNLGDPAPIDDDAHMTLLERRPWIRRTNRQLPLRFRDVLPQPLPPPSLQSVTILQPASSSVESSASQPEASESRVRDVIPRNIFGLARKYSSEATPSHDPEDHVSMQDVSNLSIHADDPNSKACFSPYPNRNAFLLGDWYWNDGVQKSQASFKRLVEIVGSPEFQPADVRGIEWHKIDKQLASDDEWEWMDEDAGWMQTPITISVPYQRRRGVPREPLAGPRDYVVGNFYRRNLISVIKNKILGLPESHLFHFEPYELTWKRAIDEHPIRVQGELYTSPAFIDAHQELQDSPREPGCDLPRVVVALMFWSDVTHLTAFGDAKLWPVYMFFGNESKYHRCRPSCHLCEHVAYFQHVGVHLAESPCLSLIDFLIASRLL